MTLFFNVFLSCIVVIRQWFCIIHSIYCGRSVPPGATTFEGQACRPLQAGTYRAGQPVTSAAALLKPNPQPKFTSAKVTRLCKGGDSYSNHIKVGGSCLKERNDLLPGQPGRPASQPASQEVGRWSSSPGHPHTKDDFSSWFFCTKNYWGGGGDF